MRSKDERTVGFIVVAMISVVVCSETRAAQSVSLGWDPSPDPTVVGYAVHYGTHSGIYTSRVDAGTNTTIVIPRLLTGLPHYFVATAYDGMGNESIPSGEVMLTAPLTSAVHPPTLDKLGSLKIDENAGPQTVKLSGITAGTNNQGMNLSVRAISINPALIPAPSIGYTSPGATGVLTFTPATNVYGSATISVIVDNGRAVSNTIRRNISVTICPTLGQLSIGSTRLQTGQIGSVAMVLSSSAGLTDLDVILDVPPGHLTNFAFQALAPEIAPPSATVTPQSATAWLLHLAAAPDQVLVGSNQVAQLGFTAIAGQPSALVPLTLRPFAATTADGVLLTNRPTTPGRIAVIGRESLLEASLDSSGKPGLTLYGKPSSSYIIEFTTNLCSPDDWVPLPSTLNPAALAIPVPLLSPAPAQIFYRAVESPTN
jgi:hypothetical protein